MLLPLLVLAPVSASALGLCFLGHWLYALRRLPFSGRSGPGFYLRSLLNCFLPMEVGMGAEALFILSCHCPFLERADTDNFFCTRLLFTPFDKCHTGISSEQASVLSCESRFCGALRRLLVMRKASMMHCLKSSWVLNRGSHGSIPDLIFPLRPFLTLSIFCWIDYLGLCTFSKFSLKTENSSLFSSSLSSYTLCS